MKLKALVAALALASGVAHAGYPTFNDATQPGALIFSMMNTSAASSSFFDLGLNSSSFSFGNVGGSTAAEIALAPSTVTTQITWNFNTGSVLSTGTKDVSSLLTGVTGSWAAAWNSYQPLVAGSVYDVFAGDNDGTAFVQKHLLSSSSNPTVSATNTQLGTALTTIATWAQAQGVTGGGNHGSVANGANVITGGAAGLYQGNVNALQTNYSGKLPGVTATGLTNTQLNFFALDGVVGASGMPVSVTNYNGNFALNEAAGTLTWTAVTAVTAVPEASTYAMLLAGLGLMGLMARRRTV